MMKDITKGFLVGTAQGFAEGVIGSIIGIGVIAVLGISMEKIKRK